MKIMNLSRINVIPESGMLIIVPSVVDIILQPIALWILLRPNTSTNAEGLTVKYTAKRECGEISLSFIVSLFYQSKYLQNLPTTN